jgi:hypothetical protein
MVDLLSTAGAGGGLDVDVSSAAGLLQERWQRGLVERNDLAHTVIAPVICG